MDESFVAVRISASLDDAYPMAPREIRNNRWGEPVLFSVDGKELPLDQADKYHDWEPKSRADTITALGNATRTDTPSPPRRTPPKTRRDPLDLYFDERDAERDG